tara:strand:+ start:42 stop:1415 length:1374 start_codon:yes stop_codon:yes gene_type:complete
MASKNTTKASKTSLEPSELFCAIGLLMPSAKMRELIRDKSGGKLIAWSATSGLDIAQSGIEPLDNKFVKMCENAPTLDGDKRTSFIANVIAGFSAAIGIKNFVKKMEHSIDVFPKIYLTGAKWPRAVDDFRLRNEDSGFDYNSSDLVVEVNDKTYYGISLKKKKNVKGADPTIINKAYSTFIDGPQFEKQRIKLNEIRQAYFPMIVKKAQDDGIINITGLKEMTPDKIWDHKVETPDGKKNYALINIKGFNSDDNPVDLTDIPGTVEGNTFFESAKKGKVGLRDYINQDLADPTNKLYEGFNKIIQNNSEYFASSLIDIVLKTQMNTKLRAKDIGDKFFEFALVTGYADYTYNAKNPSQSKLSLKPAKVIPQHTILCGLANIAGPQMRHYKMTLDVAQKDRTNAAKLFYKLTLHGVTILDIQLRYKGDFKQQPQFFATLNDNFVTQMHKDCVVRRKR